MSLNIRKLVVGDQVEVLLADSKPDHWTPTEVREFSAEGEQNIIHDGQPIPVCFVRPRRPALIGGVPHVYLTAVAGTFDALDVLIPTISGATGTRPFRELAIQGIWRNPLRGFEVHFPIRFIPDAGIPDVTKFVAYGQVQYPGFDDPGHTLRCGENCPNPNCGLENQVSANRFFSGVATSGVNLLTTEVRKGRSWDEALTAFVAAMTEVTSAYTGEFRDTYLRGPSGKTLGELLTSGAVQVIDTPEQLEALLGGGGGRGRGRRIR